MEVHHHPHVAKKNFKEYFLEFLMIFLAVTLGFFAESIRENVTDRQREKQYMESMMEDLRSDTSQMNSVIRLKQSRNDMIDSLVMYIGSTSYREHLNEIYYFARSISPPLNFFPNDRTIQQLKSSGALRLIRNLEVSNSIMIYDQKMRFQLFDLGDEQNVRLEYRKSVRNIFDGRVFMAMLENKTTITKPTNNPALLKWDPSLINDLIVDVQYVKKADQIEIGRCNELQKKAIELIQLIQKEYHLENE